MDFQLPYQILFALIVLAVASVSYGVAIAGTPTGRGFKHDLPRIMRGGLATIGGISVVMAIVFLKQV